MASCQGPPHTPKIFRRYFSQMGGKFLRKRIFAERLGGLQYQESTHARCWYKDQDLRYGVGLQCLSFGQTIH